MKRKFDSGHSVRGLAVGILTRVQQENAYSNLLLNQVLQTEHLTARDQALLTQIVYGSLQHRLTLEYWLTPFIKNKKVSEDYSWNNIARRITELIIDVNKDTL